MLILNIIVCIFVGFLWKKIKDDRLAEKFWMIRTYQQLTVSRRQC